VRALEGVDVTGQHQIHTEGEKLLLKLVQEALHLLVVVEVRVVWRRMHNYHHPRRPALGKVQGEAQVNAGARG